MKIKIDKDGLLWLERAGVMKAQVCPHGLVTNEAWNGSQFVADNGFRCGDWCPLFTTGHLVEKMGVPQPIEVTLCRTDYVVAPSDFTDERGGK
jgi:hypothetical protein